MSSLAILSSSPKTMERLARRIYPGEWAVESVQPIVTLLGSCVAVCLFESSLKFAGMNHFLLPSSRKGSRMGVDIELVGDYAMEVLVNAMLKKGARKERLIAKAFGGGSIVSSLNMPIGDMNVEFAIEWLKREGIPLHASCFGGSWSRKVICDPSTGDAFCRRAPITQEIFTQINAKETS